MEVGVQVHQRTAEQETQTDKDAEAQAKAMEVVGTIPTVVAAFYGPPCNKTKSSRSWNLRAEGMGRDDIIMQLIRGPWGDYYTTGGDGVVLTIRTCPDRHRDWEGVPKIQHFGERH